MKILSAKQTQTVDKYTIENEPIESIDLMERASNAFIDAFIEKVSPKNSIAVVAGRGNNGGDGLAIARLLIERNYNVTSYIIQPEKKGSEDFEINRGRLNKIKESEGIQNESELPDFNEFDIIIDGIFGSGLSRPVEGLYASVIDAMNSSKCTLFAIDIASGLFADQHSEGGAIVEANFTFTFQLPKLALLLPQNHKYVGEWRALDIGLDLDFIQKQSTDFEYLDKSAVAKLIKKESKFDHKGTNGKALLSCGSYGKMGAAILASKAALRCGLGLLTVHIPACGYEILQTSVPEAMADVDESDHFLSSTPKLTGIDALGVGPGLGKELETVGFLTELLRDFNKIIVFDADALNIISEHRELLEMVPAGSIITPHPKEFERLVGKWDNDFERLELQKSVAREHNIIVVVKGAHTAIATPEGKVFFNSTGNPGMATGGSGDVLTGVVTSFLAQGYTPQEAAKIGVFVHGLAGDMAASNRGVSGMIASDIIDFLPQSINSLIE